MYRSRINRKSIDDVSLDSLMDVLTCSVGVMLFVVIFAVIQVKGASVAMYTPLLHDPPEDSDRILALCQNGLIRLFDIDSALTILLSDIKKFDSAPDFVKAANKKNVSDKYFRYRLKFSDRNISIHVEAKSGIDSEGVKELKSGNSDFEMTLKELDSKQHWIAFGVDDKSLAIFRDSRLIALENGFSTGWHPMTIKFPLEQVVIGSKAGKRIKGEPLSGITFQQ